MRPRSALLIAVAGLLLLPAGASAADYRGKTSQKLKGSARVVDGRLKLVKIAWRVKCERDDIVFRNRTLWEDRPDGPIEQEGSTFTDSGKVTDEYTDARVESSLKLAGSFSDKRIKGKMTVRAKAYDKDSGEQINSCRGTIFFTLPKV